MAHVLSEPVSRVAPKKAKPKADVLLVDDNKEFGLLVQGHLEAQGYRVLCANDGETGLDLARKHKPQLVILDYLMPKMDGMSFLKALRQESQIPVVFLTGTHSDVNQILGFKLGADDYLCKPIAAEVLTARIEAVLKRAGASSGAAEKGLRRLGRVSVDPERREVRLDGKPIELTIKEFDVLQALIDARGKVLSRDYLLATVWKIGEDCEIRTRTVDQHIAGIRQKLGPEGERIMTVPPFGYRIKLA
jgi:two-component system alkaline phosphatase synthesis response regulator PhoP